SPVHQAATNKRKRRPARNQGASFLSRSTSANHSSLAGVDPRGRGGEGGGFGAQDGVAEGGGESAGGESGAAFGFRPAAFGADEQGCACVRRGAEVTQAASVEVEEDADIRGAGEGSGKRQRRGDLGRREPAGLLRRLFGDGAPALEAFGRGLDQAVVAAFGGDGRYRGDAKLRQLFDRPLETRKLDDGEV